MYVNVFTHHNEEPTNEGQSKCLICNLMHNSQCEVQQRSCNINSHFVCFVESASLYNLVNEVNLVHNFSLYVYFFSLHVPDDYVPITRRNNYIYATLVICLSVWMIV